MDIAWTMMSQIATSFNGQIIVDFLTGYAPVVSLMAVGFLLHLTPGRWEFRAMRFVTALPLPVKALLICLFAIIVMQVKSAEVQPFKYFDF